MMVSDEDSDLDEYIQNRVHFGRENRRGGSPSPSFSTQESSDDGHHSPMPEAPMPPSENGSVIDGALNDRVGNLLEYGFPADYDDKTLQARALVKLTHHAAVGTSESVIAGNDWKLSGKMCIRCEETSYYNVILTLQTSSKKDSVQLTACVQRCASRGSSNLTTYGQFKNCMINMKFFGSFGTVITKSIQVEKHGFCRGLDHPYRMEVSSATNTNFHQLEAIRSLCQTSEVKQGVRGEELVEFIPVEVDVYLRLRTAVRQDERKDLNDGYSFRIANKRKLETDFGQETWLKKLRMDDSFADVTFRVGSDFSHTFRAHKCVLAAQSPVFSAMFQADMKEKNSGEIELPDVHPTTMDSFLYLLYDGENASDFLSEPRSAMDVLEVAHKYQMQDLIDYCTRALVSMCVSKFTIKDALDLFTAAHRFGISDLQFKALQGVSHNKDKIGTAEGSEAVREFSKEQYELMPQILMGLFGNP